MPVDYAGWIPLLPLLAALWIALDSLAGSNRGEARERHVAAVAVGATALSFLLACALGVQALVVGAPGQVQVAPWLSSGDFSVDISFTLDGLGLSLSALVAFLALLTVRFSVNYMHREMGFQRFLLVLCLFASAMELIVMAGGAVLAFVGWELAGVSSYLLIAYNFERGSAGRNASRVFVTNRIGDAGFLLGIFLAFAWLGGVEWPAMTNNAAGLNPLQADLIGLAFVLAALVKSAQVPFAPWISRALEGPTPSSAIFYGSLMVHAGVYLLVRLEPVLRQAPAVLALIAALGVLTALYGWLSGLVQTDVKSSLMFSTTAQVGLMFFWIGLGWSELAAWHLGLHALWRAYQFLHAPALMHRVSRPARSVPRWLAGRRWLHAAAQNRFWLDPLADRLLVRTTRSLALDVLELDERVVSRAIGAGEAADVDMAEGDPVRGRGILGRTLEGAATLLHWIEEHLVLHGGGDGLLAAIRRVGVYAQRIEELLSQPRYLLLLIMATFVVIL
jgi:NADH:ubiquinone oxidoreductase subunit 5 (subunit L)/multisubunit Na+/H+ antiporter MnhA subunit